MPSLDPNSTRTLTVARDFRFSKLRVEVLQGPDKGLTREVRGAEFLIGAAEDNDLVLTDPSVSKHHGLLRAEPHGQYLLDQESKNGVRLAGHLVSRVQVKDGTRLNLGSTLIGFTALDEQISEPFGEDERFGHLLGVSAAMRRLVGALPRVASSDATVLLEGETGTGKGLIAEAIHRASGRAAGRMVVIDCSAIPATLIESELFGHVKGAFTGAHTSRAGAFESAASGTVFLDEIGELPLDMQPKLLRALEERTIKRVGSVEPIRLDVRVVAATHRDLRREMDRGAFRADLFYRLNVVRLRVPSLRERREDIPLLAAHFYRQVAPDAGDVPAELVSALCAQDFPGNVRELRSTVERAVLLRDAAVWEALHEPAGKSEAGEPEREVALPFRAAKDRAVARWERGYLEQLVAANKGNLSAAARAARMDRNHLRELLVKHGLIERASEATAGLGLRAR
jgi:DNA-binding NtrC family response regulator